MLFMKDSFTCLILSLNLNLSNAKVWMAVYFLISQKVPEKIVYNLSTYNCRWQQPRWEGRYRVHHGNSMKVEKILGTREKD